MALIAGMAILASGRVAVWISNFNQRIQLRAADPSDRETLRSARLSSDNSNSRYWHVQSPGKQSPERLVRFSTRGRSRQSYFQGAGVHALDHVPCGAWNHPHCENNLVRAFGELDQVFGF